MVNEYQPKPPEGVEFPYNSGRWWGMYCALIICILSLIYIIACHVVTLGTKTGKDTFRFYQESVNVLRRNHVGKR